MADDTSTMDQTGATPHLLGIPRELRDMIWKFYCADLEVHIGSNKNKTATQRGLRTSQDSVQPRVNGTAVDRARNNAGIVATCRQMRSEVIKDYYKSAIFYVDSKQALLEWLRAVPAEYRAVIRKVRFSYVTEASLRKQRDWHLTSHLMFHNLTRFQMRTKAHILFDSLRASVDSLGVRLGKDVLEISATELREWKVCWLSGSSFPAPE